MNSTQFLIRLRYAGGKKKVYCFEYSQPLSARPYGEAGCKQVIGFIIEQGSGDGNWTFGSMEQKDEIENLGVGFLFGGQHYE